MWLYVSVFLVSAATLAFEIVLSRLFAITQFYHFAFLTVSLALLGVGASGTALSISKRLRSGLPSQRMALLGLAACLTIAGSYALSNWLPFDSFAIAWDRRQVLYLALMYLALAAPFFFSALATGWLFSARPTDAPRTYTANLVGSAAGCLLALGALDKWGGESAALFCAWLAGLGAVAAFAGHITLWRQGARELTRADFVRGGVSFAALILLGVWMASPPSFLAIRLSPYKTLSQIMRDPAAEHVWTHWNIASRVDLVRSPTIRSYPGMSYAYLGELPHQDALTFDGDDLSPITYTEVQAAGFAPYMPAALAYQLRPGAEALILGARGGLDVLVALATGAADVTAVEPNEIAIDAVRRAGVFDGVRVHFVIEESRAFVRRSEQTFDVIQLPLTAPYRPVTSGAYSLAEDYDLTAQGFLDTFRRMATDGLFIATRWLQIPPSEELRLFALAVTAAEWAGLDPARSVIAMRGYNTTTVLVRKGEWQPTELDAVRQFAANRRFDLVYAPGLRAEEANQYNRLPDDEFYPAIQSLLFSSNRRAFYADYPFDVTPPTDDRPFFGHYFKWTQAAEVWAQLGKTWQPFGGAGYYVLILLLIFVSLAAGALIILPLVVRGRCGGQPTFSTQKPLWHVLVYFAAIGLGFLFVEIPLIQRLILFVGRPTYALAVALFGLLLFCSLGSLLSSRLPWRGVLVLLILTIIAYLLWLPALFQTALGLSLPLRLLLGVFSLAPLGFLMGVPLPAGVRWLECTAPELIPWAWAINGAASVVTSVLAMLIALSAGFTIVLIAGAVCYGIALASVHAT